jgi:hypothetical protein
MGLMVREPISKKLRFEVFKRDSFTCQYCGQRAPEVVLQCDHIKPVANGGASDILNLITSCIDCNSGKGPRQLSDNAVISKQLDQLARLQERREQIEMMIAWRDELARLSDATMESIALRIFEKTKMAPNDAGCANVRKWMMRYSADEILLAADAAFDGYLQWEGERPTEESWNVAFTKIPAFLSIARQEREKPYIRRLLYIQGIIRRRSGARHYNCVDYLEHIHLCGASLDDMETKAKKMGRNSLLDFEGPYDKWLAEIGRPF